MVRTFWIKSDGGVEEITSKKKCRLLNGSGSRTFVELRKKTLVFYSAWVDVAEFEASHRVHYSEETSIKKKTLVQLLKLIG